MPTSSVSCGSVRSLCGGLGVGEHAHDLRRAPLPVALHPDLGGGGDGADGCAGGGGGSVVVGTGGTRGGHRSLRQVQVPALPNGPGGSVPSLRLRIACWNLGLPGWTSHGAAAVHAFLAPPPPSSGGCHVAVLTETHLCLGDAGLLPGAAFSLPGSSTLQTIHTRALRHRRLGGQKWGGATVCAVVGGTSPITAMELVEECPSSDMVWVRLTLAGRPRPLYICAVYWPPSGSNIDSLCVAAPPCLCPRNHVHEGMAYLAGTHCKFAVDGDVVVAGDFNAAPTGHPTPAHYRSRWRELCAAVDVYCPFDQGLAAFQPWCGPDPGRPQPGLTSLSAATGCQPTTTYANPNALDHFLLGTHATTSCCPTLLPQEYLVGALSLSDHNPVFLGLCARVSAPTAVPTALSDAVAVVVSESSHARSYNKGKSFGWLSAIGVTGRANYFVRQYVKFCLTASLVAHLKLHPPAEGPASLTAGDSWRDGIYSFLNDALHSLQLVMGSRPGEVKTTIRSWTKVQGHALTRSMRALERSWKASRAEGPGVDTAQVDVAFRAARREVRRSSRSVSTAVVRRNVAAVLRARDLHDAKSGFRVLKEVMWSQTLQPKRIVDHPIMAAMEVYTGDFRSVSPRSVVAPTIDVRRSPAQLDRDAAVMHAHYVKAVLTERGVADPRFPAGPLLDAVARVRQLHSCCLADVDASPMLGRPISCSELVATLTSMDPAASSLGTAVATLREVALGRSLAATTVQQALVTHLNEEWVGLQPRLHTLRSVVTPIHKKGAVSDPSNYRTIAVGDALSRVLLTIIARRLTSFCVSEALVHENQAGFLPRRSTIEQIQFTDLLLAYYSRGQHLARQSASPVVTYLDLRRAYGSVNHSMLLAKLYDCGIQGRMWLFLARWLRGQQVAVRVGAVLSDWFPATIGVPEGGPPCPVLFLIYFDSALRAVDTVRHADAGLLTPTFPAIPRAYDGERLRHKRTVCLAFADDVKFFARSVAGMQAIVDKLAAVLVELRVLMNVGPSKTTSLLQEAVAPFVLLVPPESVAEPSETSSLLQPLPVTDAYTYLGCMESIKANGCLSHEHHVLHVIKRSKMHRGMLSSNGTLSLPPALVGVSYTSLLQAQITYGIGVFNSDRSTIPELEADFRWLATSASGTGAAGGFPAVVKCVITGLRTVEHVRDTLILQRLVACCGNRRGDCLRGLLTRELIEWQAATSVRAMQQRKSLAIDGILSLLHDLDDAIAWNATPVACVVGGGAERGRPSILAPLWYGDGIGVAGPHPVRHWTAAVCALLLFWKPDSDGTVLDVSAELVLQARLEAFRYDAMQVLSFKRQVCALWLLRSQHGLEHFNTCRRAPPYATCPRSKANTLRTLARGGVQQLLTIPVYLLLRSTRVARTLDPATPLCFSPPQHPCAPPPSAASLPVPSPPADSSQSPLDPAPFSRSPLRQRNHQWVVEAIDPSVPVCPMCDSAANLTIAHILRDCPALEAPRVQAWSEARTYLVDKGCRGILATSAADAPWVRDIWYHLTMGAECPRWYIMGDALEYEEILEAHHVASLLPNCLAAQHAYYMAAAQGSPLGLYGGYYGPAVATAPSRGSDGFDGIPPESPSPHLSESSLCPSGDAVPDDVVAFGETATLADLRPRLTPWQLKCLLSSHRRRGQPYACVLRLPSGQRVSGLGSRLCLWRGLLAATGQLLQVLVDTVTRHVLPVVVEPVQESVPVDRRRRPRVPRPLVPDSDSEAP